MKILNTLWLIILFLVLIFGFYLALSNFDIFNTYLDLPFGYQIKVGWALLLAYFLGLFLMGLRVLGESWGREKEKRQFEKIKGSREEALASLYLLAWHMATGEMGEVMASLKGIAWAREAFEAYRQQNYQETLDALKKGPAHPYRYILEAHIGLAAGKVEEAEKAWSSLADKTSLPAQVVLRNLHISKGEWAQAIKIQQGIIKMMPAKDREEGQALLLGLQYEEAKAQGEKGEVKTAIKALRSLGESHPSFVPAWVKLGDIHKREGQIDKAVQTYRQGFLLTSSIVLLHRIADLYLEREEPQKALDVLSDIVIKSKRDIIPRFFLGRLYYRLELHQQALTELEKLKDKVKTSPTLNYLLGLIYLRQGNQSLAAKAFQKTVVELGALRFEYHCVQCQKRFTEWQDNCPQCRSWNSIELDFVEEKKEPEDLGLELFPIKFPIPS